MNKSKWITVDGIDGCGKTTSIDLIKEHLESSGEKVSVVRAIGSGVNGHLFRELLINSELDVNTTALLVASCHTNCFQQITKLLDEGHTVIQDRSIASYYAYNYMVPYSGNYLRPNDSSSLLFNGFLNNRKIINRQPDISIFIDVDVERAKQRMLERNEELKYTDKGSVDFFSKLRESFIEYYSLFIKDSSFVLIDNNKSLEDLKNNLKITIDRFYSTYRS